MEKLSKERKMTLIFEIRDKICDFWGVEKIKINLSWKTAFWLNSEVITIDKNLYVIDDINRLLFAIIHELTHYIVFVKYEMGWISYKDIVHPHGKYFCQILAANIEIAGYSIASYLENAIEYLVVKKLLKKIAENEKEKKTAS